MIVEKVLNNNVVVSIEPQTRKEIILMGQGIAFGKKIGQEIDESKIEKRFMVENKTLGDKIKKLINQIPEGVFEITDEIISYASKELDTELDNQIYISLSDHISFAIKRFKNNISLKNDLLNEIRRIHKKEFKVALWVVDYLNEKLEMNKIVGIVLSLAGVYMIIGTGANIQFLGVLISFIAVIGWAFMSVISRKISNKYSALTLTKVSMLIATICNIPVSFLEVQMTHPLIQVDLGAVLGLVYMGVICTAFTNILWNKSLSLLPANTCSAFYPIQTLTSSFLGVVVFHEVLTTSFVLGSAFIIVGVLISLLFKKRTRKEKEVLV